MSNSSSTIFLPRSSRSTISSSSSSSNYYHASRNRRPLSSCSTIGRGQSVHPYSSHFAGHACTSSAGTAASSTTHRFMYAHSLSNFYDLKQSISRQQGCCTLPVPATNCQDPLLMPQSQSMSSLAKCCSPSRQSMNRFLIKKLAVSSRMTLGIQPSSLSCLMPASTSGHPVLPSFQSSKGRPGSAHLTSSNLRWKFCFSMWGKWKVRWQKQSRQQTCLTRSCSGPRVTCRMLQNSRIDRHPYFRQGAIFVVLFSGKFLFFAYSFCEARLFSIARACLRPPRSSPSWFMQKSLFYPLNQQAKRKEVGRKLLLQLTCGFATGTLTTLRQQSVKLLQQQPFLLLTRQLSLCSRLQSWSLHSQRTPAWAARACSSPLRLTAQGVMSKFSKMAVHCISEVILKKASSWLPNSRNSLEPLLRRAESRSSRHSHKNCTVLLLKQRFWEDSTCSGLKTKQQATRPHSLVARRRARLSSILKSLRNIKAPLAIFFYITIAFKTSLRITTIAPALSSTCAELSPPSAPSGPSAAPAPPQALRSAPGLDARSAQPASAESAAERSAKTVANFDSGSQFPSIQVCQANPKPTYDPSQAPQSLLIAELSISLQLYSLIQEIPSSIWPFPLAVPLPPWHPFLTPVLTTRQTPRAEGGTSPAEINPSAYGLGEQYPSSSAARAICF